MKILQELSLFFLYTINEWKFQSQLFHYLNLFEEKLLLLSACLFLLMTLYGV